MHNQKLTSEIFQLFKERKVSHRDGMAALVTALVASMLDDGICKDCALEIFGQVWDRLAPSWEAWSDQQARPN